eukprot:TRINITY_DN9354_c2_g1_i1.p1 TRINITY_DN9354_c2_g1~~TRINITY_DN9354_c2_g1_i1.p1  ORF type:complete len:561 (-),score=76.82 TRINITY_DN9354_c2_g1_i1:337-2019(-)
MEGFRLWLHPLNWKRAPLPIRIKELQHASSHDERIALLREVCCIASSYPVDVATLAEVVIRPECLIVSSQQNGSSICLPLSLAQIDQYDILEEPGQRSDAALGFIAYGYPMQANQALWRETGHGTSASAQGDVWLFVVTSDERSDSHANERCSALSEAMNALVHNGAISGDINIFEQINERVATGGFGSVQFLRRKHSTDGRIYAGKFMVGEKASSIACDECHYLLATGNHPNIVAFWGVFCFVTPLQECRWMILMESHPGGNIGERVRRHGAFSKHASLEASGDVLRALCHLHTRDIIHRDVKPANVVQASDGRAVLIDMGIAVHVSERAKLKKVCGSPGYVAPEIFHGGCEFRSDVFGCGALFYFVTSGRGPFAGSNKDETLSLNKRASLSFDDRCFLTVPWQSIEIIRHMLQRKARKRPQARSAYEVVTLVIETIPLATLPGATVQASDDAAQELAEPLHQESTSSRKDLISPQSMFSSLKSNEALSSNASSSCASSTSSSSSFLGAARKKLSAGPAVQKIVNSARKLKSLLNRVTETRTEVTPVRKPDCSGASSST